MTNSTKERAKRADDARPTSAYDGAGINSPAATWMILVGLVAVSIVLGLIFN